MGEISICRQEKGKSELNHRKHKHGKDYQVIGDLSKKGEIENKMKEVDRRQ